MFHLSFANKPRINRSGKVLIVLTTLCLLGLFTFPVHQNVVDSGIKVAIPNRGHHSPLINPDSMIETDFVVDEAFDPAVVGSGSIEEYRKVIDSLPDSEQSSSHKIRNPKVAEIATPLIMLDAIFDRIKGAHDAKIRNLPSHGIQEKIDIADDLNLDKSEKSDGGVNGYGENAKQVAVDEEAEDGAEIRNDVQDPNNDENLSDVPGSKDDVVFATDEELEDVVNDEPNVYIVSTDNKDPKITTTPTANTFSKDRKALIQSDDISVNLPKMASKSVAPIIKKEEEGRQILATFDVAENEDDAAIELGAPVLNHVEDETDDIFVAIETTPSEISGVQDVAEKFKVVPQRKAISIANIPKNLSKKLKGIQVKPKSSKQNKAPEPKFGNKKLAIDNTQNNKLLYPVAASVRHTRSRNVLPAINNAVV